MVDAKPMVSDFVSEACEEMALIFPIKTVSDIVSNFKKYTMEQKVCE